MSDKYDSYDASQQRDLDDSVERALRDVAEDNLIVYETDEEFWESFETHDEILGTFLLKVELGNHAMSSPDHLATALRTVADQVENRMEYPLPIMDANGNSVGEWTVIPS